MGSIQSILYDQGHRKKVTGESAFDGLVSSIHNAKSVLARVRGRVLVCATISTITGVLTRRLTIALCAGVLAFASLHLILSAPVDLEDEIENLLPAYMRTKEWKYSITQVNGIVDKLNAELNPTEHYKRWLPVNFGLLWTYHTFKRRNEEVENIPPTPTTNSRIYSNGIIKEDAIRTLLPAGAHRACMFATSAYGPLIGAAVGLISRKTGKEILASLMQEGTSDALRTMICSRTGVSPEDVVYLRPSVEEPISSGAESTGPNSDVGMCPMHFLAVDRRLKVIVLSIRGTASLSDALTDLLCHPREVLGGFAHDGILRSAITVLGLIEKPLVEALHANKGYGVVVTGHSLGAGVAAMIALLLNRARYNGYPGVLQLPKDTTVKAFAFAPPPIFYRLEDLGQELTKNIHCFVNELDLVPRLSYVSVLETLRKLKIVGKLDIGPFDRIRAIANPDGEVGQRVMRKVQNALIQLNSEYGRSTRQEKISTRLRQHGLMVLEIPGNIFVLRHKHKIKEKKDWNHRVFLDGIGFITSRRGALNTGKDFDEETKEEIQLEMGDAKRTDNKKSQDNVLSVSDEDCEYTARKAAGHELWEIHISTNMLSDHLPLQYEKAIRAIGEMVDLDHESKS